MEKNYWNNYYTVNNLPFENSSFATFVLNYTSQNDSLLDVGCGNGRDSIYFSKNNLQVLGIDQSSKAISNLKKYEDKNLLFDIVDVKNIDLNMFDNLYLRFLLHAINEEEEDALLKWASRNVNKYIFIENRIFEDYKTKLNHYRRLEAKEVIESKIEKLGFKILYSEVSKNFSSYKKHYNVEDLKIDPLLLRLVASKVQ